MLKCLQAITSGLEATFANYGMGGMASIFQMMEIAHTHYWSKENITAGDTSPSLLGSNSISPMGSGEILRSPASPNDSHSHSTVASENATPQQSRKASAHVERNTSVHTSNRRFSAVEGQDAPTTTDIFKDMLAQKRTALLSKLSSFDSEVGFLISSTLAD